MRTDSMKLENGRLNGLDLENYPWFYERHRIFPKVFEPGRYKRILDVAAGIGIVAKRIRDNYDCTIISNDMSEESLRSLRANDLETVSFDLDDPETPFPFEEGTFDAVLSLATLEHMINIDTHMREIHRVLKEGGHLYISTPNYSGFQFFFYYLFTGRSFHDPLSENLDKYEFYAHVRYFTYKTLLDYVSSLGFKPVRTYLPLPESSSRFLRLKSKSPIAAYIFRWTIAFLYAVLSPRWAFHPVLMFSKEKGFGDFRKIRPKKKLI